MKTEDDLHSHAMEETDAATPDKKKQDAAMPATPEMAGHAMTGDHAATMQHGSMMGMSGGDHGQQMYRDSLWASFVNLLLGIWLIASPPTLGYGGNLAWSDYASGALVIVL